MSIFSIIGFVIFILAIVTSVILTIYLNQAKKPKNETLKQRGIRNVTNCIVVLGAIIILWPHVSSLLMQAEDKKKDDERQSMIDSMDIKVYNIDKKSDSILFILDRYTDYFKRQIREKDATEEEIEVLTVYQTEPKLQYIAKINIDTAMNYIRESNFEKASEYLRIAKNACGYDSICLSQCYFHYGAAFAEAEQYDSAIEYTKLSLKANPEKIMAKYNLVALYSFVEHFQDALMVSDSILPIFDTLPQYWFNRGKVFDALMKIEDAIASYKIAINIKKDYPQAWLQLGNSYVDTGKYSDAISCYNEAIGYRENYLKAYFARGYCFDLMDSLDQALSDYEKCISIKPDYALVWIFQGNIWGFRKKDNVDKALYCFKKAIEYDNDDPGSWTNHGIILDKLGRLGEAILSFDSALFYDSLAYLAWNNRGNTYMNIAYENSKDWAKYILYLDSALTSFKKAVEIKDDFFEAWANLAGAYNSEGNYQKAFNSAKISISIQSKDFRSWYHKGIAEMGMGQVKPANASFDKALLYNSDTAFHDYIEYLKHKMNQNK